MGIFRLESFGLVFRLRYGEYVQLPRGPVNHGHKMVESERDPEVQLEVEAPLRPSTPSTSFLE